MTGVDLDEVRRLCEQASDGPWEVGVTYLTAGVARPGDRFAELGKCAACHHGEPAWTGVADINGTVRDAHQHRVSLDVLGDPSVYGGPAGQPKGVVVQGADDFGRNLSPEDAAFIAAARELIPALADEVADLRALFDLQWTRMGEATARWRAEDPEARALVMPDLGDLLQWLVGEADREHERADGWADQYNRLARKCADLRDERDTARDAERERIADWFEQEADVWRDRTGQTAVKCEYDRAAQMVRDLDPGGAR